jgi:hypothetical protein
MIEYDPIPEEAKNSGCWFKMILIGLPLSLLAYLMGDTSMIQRYGAMIGVMAVCAIGWYIISALFENIPNESSSFRMILILLVVIGCITAIVWLVNASK